MKRYFIYTLILFPLISIGQQTKKEGIVRLFFEDVFVNETPLDQISQEYRSKCRSNKDAHEVFIKCIQFLKQEHTHLVGNLTGLKVEAYRSSTLKDLWPFSKKLLKNIYVVSVNGKFERYVLMKKSKIQSFIYIKKDGVASFIPHCGIPLQK